jgi:hypothetical protein
VDEAFSRFAAADPEPKGELEYKNPFTLLVAVVLSAQATDTGVNKATRSLFAVADTPELRARYKGFEENHLNPLWSQTGDVITPAYVESTTYDAGSQLNETDRASRKGVPRSPLASGDWSIPE